MACHAKTWIAAGLAITCQLSISKADRQAPPAAAAGDFVPAVSMEADRRVRVPQLRAPRSEMARFAAVGLVQCGGAVGTAQLTLRADVITTAAHVLIAPDGSPRRGCRFTPIGGTPVAIDTASIKAGSTSPMSDSAMRDWAIARLSKPVSGAKPFGLAPPGAMPRRVTMCAAGNGAAAEMGAEDCHAHHVIKTSLDGVREIAIDCSAAAGSSGAAIMQGDKIYGIYVGYRSLNPKAQQPFSSTHYNFAITVDGAFRQALLATVR